MQPNNEQNPYQYPPQAQPQQVIVPQAGPAAPYVSPEPAGPTLSSNELSMRSSSRKRLAGLITGIVVLVAAGVTGTVLLLANHNRTTAISSTVAMVSIEPGGVTPATVSITKGQEVTITNDDSAPHRLTADQSQLPDFDSIDLLNQGDSYTYVFENTGTFHFYDPNDPGLTGTVTVQ